MAPLFKYLLLVACIIPKYHSFVDSYRMYAEKSYEKKHKLVERASSGEISKSDSLLFIPCLTIRKDVRRDWDWYNTENNENMHRCNIMNIRGAVFLNLWCIKIMNL